MQQMCHSPFGAILRLFHCLGNALSGFWQTLSQGASDEADDFATVKRRVDCAGPSVNVDGTPMLDCTIDVMGKAFGDSGSTFGHDTFGADDSFHSGLND